MPKFKIDILKYFLWFRFRRKFFSNSISKSTIRKWNKNLLKSFFYKKFNGDFPVINKAVFMQHFNSINTVSVSKNEALRIAKKANESRNFTNEINGISVGLSSGTSGNFGIFLTSKREKAIWVAAVLDRVIGFSLKKRKVAFFLRANNNLYESVKSSLLQFSFYDLASPFEELFQKLLTQNASILVAQPSVLNEIAKRFEIEKIDYQFSKVISVAEVLEEDQKQYFQSIFKVKIEQVYQCTEGFLAHTCKKGNLHFNEDFIKIEPKYLDDSKTRFHPIITDYLRFSQPIARYELDDIIQFGQVCDCGSKAKTIKKIEGRADDVFRFNVKEKEVLIFPDFVRRTVLKSDPNISNYRISLKHENTISIYLELKNELNYNITFEKVKENIKDLLLTYGIENINFVEGTYHNNFTKKFKRISNEL